MKNTKYISIFILASVFLFSAVPGLVQAGLVPCGEPGNPCQFCHIFVLIERIIDFTFTVLVPIAATIMLILGGFYLLVAGPSPEKVNQAKKILTAAVIGIAIIFLSWIFLNQLLVAMEIKEWTGLVDDPDTPTVIEGGWYDFTEKCPIK